MLKLLLPLVLVLSTLSTSAQTGALDKFYEKYGALNDGADSVSEDSAAMKTVTVKPTPGAKIGWFKKVTGTRVLVIHHESDSIANEWEELFQSIKADHMEELMSEQSGESKLQLFLKNLKNGKKALVITARNPTDDGFFIEFDGRFTESDMAEWESNMEKTHGAATINVNQ